MRARPHGPVAVSRFAAAGGRNPRQTFRGQPVPHGDSAAESRLPRKADQSQTPGRVQEPAAVHRRGARSLGRAAGPRCQARRAASPSAVGAAADRCLRRVRLARSEIGHRAALAFGRRSRASLLVDPQSGDQTDRIGVRRDRHGQAGRGRTQLQLGHRPDIPLPRRRLAFLEPGAAADQGADRFDRRGIFVSRRHAAQAVGPFGGARQHDRRPHRLSQNARHVVGAASAAQSPRDCRRSVGRRGIPAAGRAALVWRADRADSRDDPRR